MKSETRRVKSERDSRTRELRLRPALSPFQRPALTLIELLVVIVILTTLVGGVIPLLSPNNDVRKIQAASRGLQGYITQAKAQAARTGRPQGIAFSESSPESGVALEVFGWEVPPPFAGFSTESRVKVERIVDLSLGSNEITYGVKNPAAPLPPNPKGNRGEKFSPQYFGYELYRLRFELAVPPIPPATFVTDQLPPRTFRVGDIIDVRGNEFLIVDDYENSNDREPRNRVDTFSNVEYLNPNLNANGDFVDSVVCVWINNSGQALAPGLKQYKINRQPATSSAPPYQLPASIVIDMQGSVTEGNSTGVRFPTPSSLSLAAVATTDTIGIMFSPTGGVDSVYFNGNQLTSVSRIVLLLGRIENGGLTGTEWTIGTGDTDDQLKEKQKEINWLNLDSRLLSIITSNGRAVVSEPAFVDARIYGAETPADQADDQLEAAHEFAHEMTTAK